MIVKLYTPEQLTEMEKLFAILALEQEAHLVRVQPIVDRLIEIREDSPCFVDVTP